MPTAHQLLTLLLVFVWGLNFVAIKLSLVDISPWLLSALRFFLTSIPAIFFLKKPNISFFSLLLYGLTTFCFPFTLLFLAIHVGLPPGLAALLLQLQVFFTLILGTLFLKERLHSWQISGMILSLGGILFIAIYGQHELPWLGLSLVLGAAASWGIGNIVAKKIGKVSASSLVAWGSLIAWPLPLTLFLCQEHPSYIFTALTQISYISWGSALYIAYLATTFGFALWSYLLNEHRIGVIAPFTLLVPLIGMASSALFLNETLPSWKIFGGLLVIAGLILHMIGQRASTFSAPKKDEASLESPS